MNNFSVISFTIFGTILVLFHFGVEADSSSTCSIPGMPGKDRLPGQPGRDGRDGLSGAAGSPGSKLSMYPL